MNQLNPNLLPQPVLPDTYQYYRSWISPVHTLLAGVSLREIAESMPPLQRDENGTAYAVFEPPLNPDYDRTHAIIAPFTFANNYGPNWAIRLRYLQGSIKQATGHDIAVVAFPNTTTRRARGAVRPHQTHMHTFQADELSLIEAGDWRPYAERHAAIIEKLGIESVSGFGMSMGGSVLVRDARQIVKKGVAEVTDLTFIDPATLHGEADEKTMRNGFITTIQDFHQAVLDSEVPAYTMAQNARYSSFHRQIAGSVAGTLGDKKVPEAAAQRKGMTVGNFIDGLERFSAESPRTATSVVTGENSGISNIDDEQSAYLAALPNTELFRNLPYGHAITNHLGLVSIIGTLTYRRGLTLRTA